MLVKEADVQLMKWKVITLLGIRMQPEKMQTSMHH